MLAQIFVQIWNQLQTKHARNYATDINFYHCDLQKLISETAKILTHKISTHTKYSTQNFKPSHINTYATYFVVKLVRC